MHGKYTTKPLIFFQRPDLVAFDLCLIRKCETNTDFIIIVEFTLSLTLVIGSQKNLTQLVLLTWAPGKLEQN